MLLTTTARFSYEDEDNAWIDCEPGYKTDDMTAALAEAELYGMEPIPDDECLPLIAEDGSMRIYLTEVI